MAAGPPAILVTIAEARGSTPRGAGTAMRVGSDWTEGTIGGGQLELRAIQEARAMLRRGAIRHQLLLPLGPALGQCCGGHVRLDFALLDGALEALLAAEQTAAHALLPEVLLFGAGHVGRAVATALSPLPCRLLWIDERPDAFPASWPETVQARWLKDPVDALRTAAAGGYVLIMTHSHPRDLDLVAAALQRGDMALVGLIGSATKRARFERQLQALGIAPERIAGLACPIGLDGIRGKEPAVIAASVAADLLLRFEQRAVASTPSSRRSVA